MTIRISHTGDLHYSNTTLEEVERCMEAFVASATSPSIDAIVIGGDSTDHRLDAHTPAFLALARRVKQMADVKPIIMLQGTFSHEPPGVLSLFGMLSDKVFVADRICQVALTTSGLWMPSTAFCFAVDEFESLVALNGAPKAVFTCLPTVNKAILVASTGSTDSADLGNVVAQVLQGFAASNDRFSCAGIPTIGMSHGTVHNSRTEHGVPMHGADHEFTSGSLFSAGCSAFTLNHIHLHQDWEVNGRRAAYSGSLPCLHYGEVGQKGWIEWTVDAKTSEFNFMPSPAQQFAEFNFSDVPDMEQLTCADVTGKKVRVRYVVDFEHRHVVNDDAIRAALVGAMEVNIEPRILPMLRTRAEGMSDASTDAEKLQMWMTVTRTDRPQLLDCLVILATGDPESVAKALMDHAMQLARQSATTTQDVPELGAA